MKTSGQQASEPISNQVVFLSAGDFLSGLVMILLVMFSRLVAENKRLAAQVAELEGALKLAQAKRFGNSSERSSSPNGDDPAPVIIEGEASEIPASSPADPAKQSRRQAGGQPGHKGHGRSTPPALPRQETFYELPEEPRMKLGFTRTI